MPRNKGSTSHQIVLAGKRENNRHFPLKLLDQNGNEARNKNIVVTDVEKDLTVTLYINRAKTIEKLGEIMLSWEDSSFNNSSIQRVFLAESKVAS